MNEVIKAIKSRRSVRAFKTEQLKQADLDILMEAAIYAPSGRNKQPWHFTVIQNREIIEKMSDTAKTVMLKTEYEWMRNIGANPDFDLTYGAPTLIIVSGEQNNNTVIADCAAAIQNILLAAESLGISSVWIGLIIYCFAVEGETAKIGIPDGYEPLYGIALGYRRNEAKLEAPPRKRDVVNYIK